MLKELKKFFVPGAKYRWTQHIRNLTEDKTFIRINKKDFVFNTKRGASYLPFPPEKDIVIDGDTAKIYFEGNLVISYQKIC